MRSPLIVLSLAACGGSSDRPDAAGVDALESMGTTTVPSTVIVPEPARARLPRYLWERASTRTPAKVSSPRGSGSGTGSVGSATAGRSSRTPDSFSSAAAADW